MTPQVRSRNLLMEEGYLVATIEAQKRFPDKKSGPCPTCQHQPEISVRVDLWNCFDLIAEHPQRKERLYVQVTSGAHHADRKHKVLGSFETKLVLLAGARVFIHSWQKDERLNRWTVREEEITLKDFRQAPHYPSTVQALLEIRRKAKMPDLPQGVTLPLAGLTADEF